MYHLNIMNAICWQIINTNVYKKFLKLLVITSKILKEQFDCENLKYINIFYCFLNLDIPYIENLVYNNYCFV